MARPSSLSSWNFTEDTLNVVVSGGAVGTNLEALASRRHRAHCGPFSAGVTRSASRRAAAVTFAILGAVNWTRAGSTRCLGNL